VLETKPNASVDEIDNLVAGRLARQSVLGRDDPPAPLVYALIDEGALNRPVAPPAVMHDQLAHLVDVTGGRVCEDAATVAEVVLRFNALRSEALPTGPSRILMESVAERWKEATSLAGGSPATAATTAATA
jgi:Domain of unknown function (DUF5753)